MKKIAIPIRIIVLRNREQIKVSMETGERIKQQLANMTQNVFITIKELDRIINTADIVEVKNDVETDYEPEEEEIIPPEQQKRVRRMVENLGRELKEKGIIATQEPTKKRYGVKRSELIKYKEKFGEDYKLTDGMEVLED